MDDESFNSSSCGNIVASLLKLEDFIRNKGYAGIDPYDALNSNIFKFIRNKYINLIATQILVYSPINIRPELGIREERNPKALGIILQAYCNMYKADLISIERFEHIYKELVDFLLENYSKGYSGFCWGYNFDWQDITRFSNKGLPSVVITSYIGNAFLDLFEIILDNKYLEIAKSCCDFILNDVNINKFDDDICFSYTPADKLVIHNANLLGASFMSRVYSITKDARLFDYSKKAIDFSISQQKDNGSWAYSLNLNDNKERYQIDFHQGFNLDSLCNFIKYAKPREDKYKNSLLKGAEFYLVNQFDNDGRSKWRWPKRWPIDIHHQAQGIITFSKIFEIYREERYIEAAGKIAAWTIKNMQGNEGDFYYQKWPLFTNKISYMRWGQAWMILALSTYIYQQKLKDKTNDQDSEQHGLRAI